MFKSLIVDDSRSTVELLTAFLSSYGPCVSAANGQEAVTLYRESVEENAPFELVVMDQVMPVMDGITALGIICDIHARMQPEGESRTRFVMLSCVDDPAHMAKAQFDACVDAYVTKPCDLRTLTEALVNLGLAENPAEEVLDAIDPEEYT